MPGADSYPEGSTPHVFDSRQRLLVKIASAINAGAGGGFTGSGSPEGVQAGNIGQHYWDNTNRIDYVKTSGTGTDTGWEVFLGI